MGKSVDMETCSSALDCQEAQVAPTWHYSSPAIEWECLSVHGSGYLGSSSHRNGRTVHRCKASDIEESMVKARREEEARRRW